MRERIFDNQKRLGVGGIDKFHGKLRELRYVNEALLI